MVQIEKYLGTQIDQLSAMIAGRVLYDSTINALRYNDSTTYNNILLHKDINNNLTSINNVNTTGTLGINTSAPDKQLEINSATGDCLRLTFDDNNGSAANYADLSVSSSGNLTLTPSGGNINISSHNGSTTGLQLAGTLVTSTADELNFVDVTPGVATASKALVLDANKDIATINHLTATTLTGTLDTAAQPNLTSLGTLDSLTSNGIVNIAEHNGVDKGLQLGGVLITASAEEINYLDIGNPGIAEPLKVMVPDSNRNMVNLNYIEVQHMNCIKQSASNNSVEYPISLLTLPDTTAANGIGTGVELLSVNGNNDIYSAAYINAVTSDVTADSETSYFDFRLVGEGVINSVATLSHLGILSCSSVAEVSDIRTKRDIEDVDQKESLENILKVDVKTYNYKYDSTKKQQQGVIAQNIANIFPHCIEELGEKYGVSDCLSVKYTSLVPALINCVKELHREIEELKQKCPNQ